MSCFASNCYLPQPPRAWSRVQNACTYLNDDVANTGAILEKTAMLNKGNVLQYKANSSNLTKSQKYSKIAQGQWINRNITWATQSTRGYTNPNTTSLKRTSNAINIAIDPANGTIIGPSFNSVTCPQPVNPIYDELPTNIPDTSGDPEPPIPPPIDPTPASDTFPNIEPEQPIEPIIIQDGGSLICSIQENVCTGETKISVSQQLCHPTTDSDVPGPIQELCWNDGTPTWYPRSRYIMTNSTNKWPTNYKFFVSAVRPPTPILSSSTSINGSLIDLTWFVSSINGCLPILGYNIYINNTLSYKVESNITSLSLNEPNGQYIIYVTSFNNGIESFKSNEINIMVSN